MKRTYTSQKIQERKYTHEDEKEKREKKNQKEIYS